MKKEMLRKYLNNQLLVQAIKAKMEIDKMRKGILSAIETLYIAGISKTAIDEIQDKCDEYAKVHAGYGGMIENLWGLTWQNEAIITQYIDCSDDEIDALPEHIYLK